MQRVPEPEYNVPEPFQLPEAEHKPNIQINCFTDARTRSRIMSQKTTKFSTTSSKADDIDESNE
uniref:Uncharacterized protein n=1 Tax=Romanomermis culicivorax TaxID=13658 RepID=A0A915L1D9_ROMCU